MLFLLTAVVYLAGQPNSWHRERQLAASVETAVAGRQLAGQWDIRHLAGRVGAEIRGVDLRDGLTEEQAEDLRWILAEHGVVVFTDQRLDDEGHKALAAHLG